MYVHIYINIYICRYIYIYIYIEREREGGRKEGREGGRERKHTAFLVDAQTYSLAQSNHVTVHPPHPYRGTSLIRNSARRGPYSRNMPRALSWS